MKVKVAAQIELFNNLKSQNNMLTRLRLLMPKAPAVKSLSKKNSRFRESNHSLCEAQIKTKL